MANIKVYNIRLTEDESKLNSLPERPSNQADRLLPLSAPHITLIHLVEKDDYAERIFIDLPKDEKRLRDTLSVEMEYLYIRFGKDGLEAVSDAIDKMDEDPDPDAESHQKKAEAIFEEFQDAMEKRAKAVCQTIQSKAVEIAFDKLKDSINEILNESVRYLSGIYNHDVAKTLFYHNPNTWDLKTGDAENLIRALLRLRDLRNEMNNSQIGLQSVNQSRSPVPMNVVNKVKQKAEESSQNYMEALSSYCLRFPIMHRLWNTEHVPVYDKGDNTVLTVSGDQASVLAALKSEIFDILKSSYKAAQSLLGDIHDDKEEVWKYRPLIEEALEELDQDDASFSARAAEERLAEHTYEDWISHAQWAVAGAQVLAVIASPAPPVALTIEAASVMLDVVAIGMEAYQNYQQSKASKAVLDPTKSLIGEPGWGHFMLNVALSVLFDTPWGKAAKIKM